MRRLVVVVGALAMVVAAACSGSPPSTSGVEAVARAEVQDLRVAVGDDPFLRASPNLGLLADGLNPGIFETLTRLTPSFGLTGGLATRWEAQNPTRWRFELRPDVRFHDGTSLTAGAVVDMVEAVVAGSAGTGRDGVDGENVFRRQSVPRGLGPGSATAESDLVVRIDLQEPNLRLAEQLANPTMAVVAPGTRAGDGSSPVQTPTGTGPFMFASYLPGNELRVVRFDEYWDGPAELSAITFRFGPPADASRLLATRQVDLVGQVPPSMLASVSGRTERAAASPPARTVFLLLNRGGVGEWATLQEDALRRALAAALDREAIAEAGWPDFGDPSDSVVPPVILDEAADAVAVVEHDADSARQVLDDAGWLLGPDGIRSRDGQRLSLSLLSRRPESAPAPAIEALGVQLAAVGMELQVDPQGAGEPSPLQRVNAATFDLFLDIRPQDDANPCALCRLFSIRPGGQLSVSGVVGAGAAGDALFDQVHEAPSTDSARRLTAQLMGVVAADEMVAIPLAALANPWLVSSRVQGFEPAGLAGAQRWDAVFLSP